MGECVRKEEEGREGRWSAYEGESVKEGGPRFTRGAVLDSSCFHTRGFSDCLFPFYCLAFTFNCKKVTEFKGSGL